MHSDAKSMALNSPGKPYLHYPVSSRICSSVISGIRWNLISRCIQNPVKKCIRYIPSYNPYVREPERGHARNYIFQYKVPYFCDAAAPQQVRLLQTCSEKVRPWFVIPCPFMSGNLHPLKLWKCEDWISVPSGETFPINLSNLLATCPCWCHLPTGMGCF